MYEFNLSFYGLLHLDQNERSAMNVKTDDFDDQIELYLRNAAVIDRSLRNKGLKFTLLCNSKERVLSIMDCIGLKFDIAEINFDSHIPRGVRFYSAHFKKDVFKYFSTREYEYSILLDLDMICVNDLPAQFMTLISSRVPVYFDITSQVAEAHGGEAIFNDISKLTKRPSEGRWAGGEFIGGDNSFFSDLTVEIEKVWPEYLRNIENLHHIGDEMFVSAALEAMRLRGRYVADAGSIGVVARHWSSETLHFQSPVNSIQRFFLLHLPSDKRFIARLSENEHLNAGDFFKRYKRHLLQRRILSKAKGFLINTLRVRKGSS